MSSLAVVRLPRKWLCVVVVVAEHDDVEGRGVTEGLEVVGALDVVLLEHAEYDCSAARLHSNH